MNSFKDISLSNFERSGQNATAKILLKSLFLAVGLKLPEKHPKQQ